MFLEKKIELQEANNRRFNARHLLLFIKRQIPIEHKNDISIRDNFLN